MYHLGEQYLPKNIANKKLNTIHIIIKIDIWNLYTLKRKNKNIKVYKYKGKFKRY